MKKGESKKTKHITLNSPRLRADANAMGTKRNVVLYLDKKLVQKSKSLGFNLSKTFENHLKHVKMQFTHTYELTFSLFLRVTCANKSTNPSVSPYTIALSKGCDHVSNRAGI